MIADPGARYERLDSAELDEATYDLVKITFATGTGDSPDDYYILYLHPETHRLAALRYVVAYPGFFPDGGHTPEKLMRYTDWRPVGELYLAHTLDTYAYDAESGTPGEKVTSIAVRDVQLAQPIPADAFAPPEDATVSTTI